MRALALLGVLAVALAGCTAPAAVPTEGGAAPAGPSATGSASAGGAALLTPLANATGPFDLHLQPDLTLAPDPSPEGRVTLATPANGPVTPGSPSWSGTLAGPVNLTADGVPVVLYIATNSASLRANALPLFADLPGMFLVLGIGGKEVRGETEGEAVLVAGEVYEVRAVLQGDTGYVAAGAEVTLSTGVIYSHVTGAAEYQFVMGPDHPARLTLPGA